MGMFTAKSKAWEILNLFLVFISTLSLVFFQIGIISKKNHG